MDLFSDFWFWAFWIQNILIYLTYKFPPASSLALINEFLQKFRYYLFRKKSPGRRKEDFWILYPYVKEIKNEHPNWGISRIHSEILMLGFKISRTTIQRILKYLEKAPRPTSGIKQWMRILNHIQEYAVQMDFCQIKSITGKTFFCLAFIHIQSRKIIHFNLTFHPSRAWVLRQIQEAKEQFEDLHFLIQDNDILFSGKLIGEGIRKLGVSVINTPIASPWYNCYIERWNGSFRRECLDHIPVFSLNHAQAVASEYINYYNNWRPHLALNKNSPEGRVVTFPSYTSKLLKKKVLGGLHHVYFHSEVA